MGKSAAARKPVAAPAAPKPAARLAPVAAGDDSKHAPAPELKDFEAAPPIVNLDDDDGEMHGPMHEGMESDMHFGDEIHGDVMAQDWKPPEALAAPDARPGMTQRWIRSSLLGKPDARNVALQGGQGWRPRALTSVPEGERKLYPTTKDKRSAAEFMVSGDLVLCEMPTSRFNQISQHYRGKAKGQSDALLAKELTGAAEAGSEKHGIGAPYVAERNSKVSTRRPIVAADR